jgi:hypothetical protein
LKIVSKDSIASTFAREGSSLTNHWEVTLAASRHEEKKRINHHEPATEYPKLLIAIKLVRTSWIKCVDPSQEEALVTLVWD